MHRARITGWRCGRSATAGKLAEEWPQGCKAEKKLIAHCGGTGRRWSPGWSELKALEPLAHVLFQRFLDSKNTYLQAGLGPRTPRRRQKDWLIKEPETHY